MKQLKYKVQLVQDKNVQHVLNAIIDELERIKSVPSLDNTADINKIRRAVNSLIGKFR